MRKVCSMLSGICVATSLLGAASQAGSDSELPLRKAGLWKVTTVMDEGGGPKEHVLTMCIDAEMERNTAASSKFEHQQNCEEYKVSKVAERFVVESRCNFNQRDVVSRTEMSGDFAKSFAVKIDSTTSGADGSRSVSVKRTITQSGDYVGESCGDLKGGEAMGSDGAKVLVQ